MLALLAITSVDVPWATTQIREESYVFMWTIEGRNRRKCTLWKYWNHGEFCVSLSFLPWYLPNNSYIKITTIDEDCVYTTQSMFT